MSDRAIKQEVIGVFDRAASLYDQVGTRQFTYFADLLVKRLALPSGASVLDLATGRGALLFAAAVQVGSTGQVIGIDLAPQMVNQTHAQIQQKGLNRTHALLMDGDALGFAPHSFDYVLCGFALHFLDYERVLPQILKYLKPGGGFAAILPQTPSRDEDLARWRWLFDLTKAVFPPDFVPPPAWIAPRRLNKPELVEDALRQAGFVNVRTERHEADLFFKDEDDWWSWEWSQGSRFWLEGMSPEGLDCFRRESYAHLHAMKQPNGIPMRDGVLFAICNAEQKG